MQTIACRFHMPAASKLACAVANYWHHNPRRAVIGFSKSTYR